MALIERDPIAIPGATRHTDLLKAGLPPVLVFIAVMTLWQTGIFHLLLNIKTFQLPLPSQIIESFGARGRDL
ncbi:MAG TPA: hypothetical protein VFG99_07420, partial [Chloroflexia bacterium]|nr:hypothetical protein [Chloroflexia bacterium]